MSDKPIDWGKLEEYSRERRPVEPEWKVKSPDGTEYGPYRYSQIEQFVAEQRILESFTIYHPTKTHGKWLPVAKIPKLTALVPTKIIAPPVTPPTVLQVVPPATFQFIINEIGQISVKWDSPEQAVQLCRHIERTQEDVELLLMGIIEQQRTTGAGYDNTNAIAGPSLWRYSRGGLGGAMYALQLGVKAIAGVKYGVTNSSLEKQRSYYAALRINLAHIALKVARWLEENAPEYLQKK